MMTRIDEPWNEYNKIIIFISKEIHPLKENKYLFFYTNVWCKDWSLGGKKTLNRFINEKYL